MTAKLSPPPPRETVLNSPGQKPKLKWIPIGELYVDQEYQRGTNSKSSRRNLEYMKENFSWAHCGALMVCFMPVTNNYAVVDGQHRLLAAQARGDITELPCMVIEGQNFEKQAKSFVIVNTKRVGMNTLAKFHGAAAAGDLETSALKKLVAECDIEIPRTQLLPDETGPRQTQATGTLLSLMHKYTNDQVKWALTIIPEAYGEKKGMLRSMLIKALVEFINLNSDATRPRMIAVLKEIDPEKFERSAVAASGLGGCTTLRAMVQSLERLYKNIGRKGSEYSKPPATPIPPAAKPTPKSLQEQYIGQRIDGHVKDEDWQDVKAMIETDISVFDIAKKYNVPRPEMKDFIDRHTADDNKCASQFNSSKKRTIGA